MLQHVWYPTLVLLFLTVNHCEAAAASRHVASTSTQSNKKSWNCSAADTTAYDMATPHRYNDDIYSRNSTRSSPTDDFTLRQYRGSWSPYDYLNTPLPKCTSADENTRGIYSSDLSPCEIAFHKSEVPHDENGFNLLVPEACTTDNRVVLSGTNTKTISQNIFYWKDECIGDFTRCYSLATDQRIYLGLVCRKNWKMPAGATHMSVNCTNDKLLKEASLEKYKSERYDSDHEYMKEQQRTWHQLVALVATVLAVLVLSCVGCCALAYCCVIKPYFAMAQANRHAEIKDLLYRSNSIGTMATAEIA